jgi:hypothetical protein
LLADVTAHYVFVSSISVYRDFARPGFDESYPTGELPDDHGEDVARFYGQLKAAAERRSCARSTATVAPSSGPA